MYDLARLHVNIRLIREDADNPARDAQIRRAIAGSVPGMHPEHVHVESNTVEVVASARYEHMVPLPVVLLPDQHIGLWDSDFDPSGDDSVSMVFVVTEVTHMIQDRTRHVEVEATVRDDEGYYERVIGFLKNLGFTKEEPDHAV